MSILEQIGNTPLVEIQNLNSNRDVKVYAKLEGNNPGGSVKDRAAYGMIMHALQSGELKQGDRLVEATSGNTGIALAMIARRLGLEMTLLMPAKATKERIDIMRAYGAEVILTDINKTIEHSRTLAIEMVEKEGYKMLNQFANPQNFMAHYRTTGPEIYQDTQAEITHFVSAMGTTGTIMGVSKYLKEKNKNIQIVGCQPTEGSSIPGIRRWSPEFLPEIFDPSRVDRTIDVSEQEAKTMAKRLAREEGIFAGISSGGAMHVAVRIAQELSSGTIVSIVCDRGDRYLSSGIFSD